MIAAQTKIGKSMLAAELTAALATGTPFLGRRTTLSKVVVLTGETCVKKYQQRIDAAYTARGFPPYWDCGDPYYETGR